LKNVESLYQPCRQGSNNRDAQDLSTPHAMTIGVTGVTTETTGTNRKVVDTAVAIADPTIEVATIEVAAVEPDRNRLAHSKANRLDNNRLVNNLEDNSLRDSDPVVAMVGIAVPARPAAAPEGAGSHQAKEPVEIPVEVAKVVEIAIAMDEETRIVIDPMVEAK